MWLESQCWYIYIYLHLSQVTGVCREMCKHKDEMPFKLWFMHAGWCWNIIFWQEERNLKAVRYSIILMQARTDFGYMHERTVGLGTWLTLWYVSLYDLLYSIIVCCSAPKNWVTMTTAVSTNPSWGVRINARLVSSWISLGCQDMYTLSVWVALVGTLIGCTNNTIALQSTKPCIHI